MSLFRPWELKKEKNEKSPSAKGAMTMRLASPRNEGTKTRVGTLCGVDSLGKWERDAGKKERRKLIAEPNSADGLCPPT